MAEQQHRVVAAFDDPDDAKAAEEELEQRGERTEEDAPADAEVAFASTEERGDSAERPPDTTVAVEVDADQTDEAAEALRNRGAEDVEVGQPVEPDDASSFPRPDEP